MNPKNYSTRSGRTSASSIRELFKMLKDPEFISLAGGAPDPEMFPIAKVSEYAQAALAESGKEILQYSATDGMPEFKELLIGYLQKTKGITVESNNICVTAGGQNAIDTMAKLFIDEGDTVVTEKPTFLAALKSYELFGANLLQIDIDEEGMRLDILADKLANGLKPKFIYVIPNFQNPTGLSMSTDRRKQLAELANTYDLTIIEDDPYYESRFLGKQPPTIYSLVPKNTIYLGSFSKVISPGMRLGYMISNPETMSKAVLIRQINDVHTNNLSQAVVGKFIANGEIATVIANNQKFYAKKLERALNLIEELFPKDVYYTKPQGGMFIWVKLPERFDFTEINQKLLAQKIGVVPGKDFFAKSEQIPSNTNTFRLNFTNSQLQNLEEGVRKIAEVLRAGTH